MVPREESIAPVEPVVGGHSSGSLGYGSPQGGSRPTGTRAGEGTTARRRWADLGDGFKARLQIEQAELSIEKDEPSGKMVVRLSDPRTGELIRQIPSEEMLRIAREMGEYLGLLVDGQQ